MHIAGGGAITNIFRSKLKAREIWICSSVYSTPYLHYTSLWAGSISATSNTHYIFHHHHSKEDISFQWGIVLTCESTPQELFFIHQSMVVRLHAILRGPISRDALSKGWRCFIMTLDWEDNCCKLRNPPLPVPSHFTSSPPSYPYLFSSTFRSSGFAGDSG